MKINFTILGKAIWLTIKPFLIGIGLACIVAPIIFAIGYYAGNFAPLAFLMLAFMIWSTGGIMSRYETLMRENKEDQEKMIDILKR